MPIEKMRIRPNGAIVVLRAMVVGEQAFCFSVDPATFKIGQCEEEKARHSSTRSTLCFTKMERVPEVLQFSVIVE
jgi:hypothetical protein